MAKNVYRLWAIVYTNESAPLLENAKFSRLNVSEQYFLVYSDKKPKGELILTEVKDADAQLLNEDERKWLFECNLQILAAEARVRKKDILRDLSLKVGALEEALREQARKEATASERENAEGGTPSE